MNTALIGYDDGSKNYLGRREPIRNGEDPLAKAIVRMWERMKRVRAKTEKLRWEACAYVQHRMDEFSIGKSPIKPINIYNTAGIDAFETFVNGYHGNLISPAMRWFSFFMFGENFEDPDSIQGANDFLELCETLMYGELNKSNFYPIDKLATKDAAVQGTSAEFIIDDVERGICVYDAIPPWDFWIAANHQGIIDTFFYRYDLTAEQAVERFGESVGEFVLRDVQQDNGDAEHEFLLAIYPRKTMRDERGEILPASMKPFAAVTYSKTDDRIVDIGGYDDLPVAVHIWEQDGTSVYGKGLVMRYLPELRRLNEMSKRDVTAVQKISDPPMAVPESLKGRYSLDPGARNYMGNVEQRPQPIQTVTDIGWLDKKLQELEAKIKRLFFNDLFNYLMRQDKVLTAMQVQAIKTEELVLLSSILGTTQFMKINPIILRTFKIMVKGGRVPTPPKELLRIKNALMKIELDGPLAKNVKAYTMQDGLNSSLEILQALQALQLQHTFDNVDLDKFARKILIKSADLAKTHMKIGTVKLTLDEAIGVYVYAQQPAALEKLLSSDGNRLTMENVNSIVESLSDNQKQWGDFLIEEMTSRYDALAYVYHMVSNKKLGKVVKYFPLVRGDKEATMTDMLDEEYFDREQAPSQQMLKERVGGKYPLNLSATTTWNNMVRKQEHYIAAAEWVNDTQFLLRKTGGDLYDSIALAKGSDYAEALQKFVDNFANKQTIQDNASTIVNAIRNNLIVARLGFNIITALKQIPSLTYFLREFGPIRLMESLGQVLTGGKATAEFIYERAPQLRNRSVSTEFSAIAEIEGKNAYQRMVKSVGEAGMYPIKIMDKMVVNTLWLGAYNAKLAKGLSPDVAAIEATRFIGDTQPGGGVANSAAIYASNDMLVKFLTMFTNQLNKNFNIIYADIPYALKHKMYKNAVANMMGLGLGFAGIILVSGGFIDDDDDDDEYGEQLLKQFAGQLLTQIPVIGKDATNILLDQFYADNGMLLVSETNSLIKAIVSKDPERVADRATRFGVGVMEMMGLPSGISDKAHKALFKDEEINLGYLLNSAWGKYFSD